MKRNKLTPKQQRFINEYLKTLNATEAALKAGYSKKTAHSIGHENLSKPEIAKQIQARRDEIKEKLEIDQEWVLERYKRLVEIDPADFLDDGGRLKNIKDMPADVRFALQGIDLSEVTLGDDSRVSTKKIKMTDKRNALDSIAKLLGLVVDRTKLEGEITMKHDLSERLQRALENKRKHE